MKLIRNSRTARLLIGATMGCCLSAPALACPNLLAFTGKDANGDDEFAFVALRDIPMGTEIYFTNYDWDNNTGAFTTATTEGTLRFTSTNLIPAGTVVQVIEVGVEQYSVIGDGTAVHVSGTWAAVSADPHYAFSASNPLSPLDSVTEIFAYMDTDPDDASGGSKDPRIGTNPSPNAVFLDFFAIQPVGADFIADRILATPADLADAANFIDSSGAVDLTLDLDPFPLIAVDLVYCDGFDS